jgi:hypothetical protein
VSFDPSQIRKDIWRGTSDFTNTLSLPTGYPQLDQYLPGGGWPLGELTEILVENTTETPLWLIAPALVALNHEQRWQAWVAPTDIPYAPALASAGINLSKMLLIHPTTYNDLLWTIEQSLGSKICSAVLSWPQRLHGIASRRLQLAAKRGRSWGLCFCPYNHAQYQTMAALRLLFRPNRRGAEITILKCRGGRPIKNLQLIREVSPHGYSG